MRLLVAGWYQVQSVRLLVAGCWFGGWMVSGAIGTPPGGWWMVRGLDGIRCNRYASWWLVAGSVAGMASGAIGTPPGGWWLVRGWMVSGAIGTPPGGWWMVRGLDGIRCNRYASWWMVAGSGLVWHQVQSVRLLGDRFAYFSQSSREETAPKCTGRG